MGSRTSAWLPLLLLAALAAAAQAQVPLQGAFMARKSCPALQSIKTGANPGNATVTAGETYTLAGKNKDQATHFWIEIDGAEPKRRWVSVECGTADARTAEAKPTDRGRRDKGEPFYILAVSWQSAFCEGMPDKAECISQTETRYDASHLALHGLWPQPRSNVYCAKDGKLKAAAEAGRWAKLPPLELSGTTRGQLETVMPGTQSHLDRYEWIKHGTCYPAGAAEAYYKDSLRLMDELNRSPVRVLLAGRIGKQVTIGEIRAAFDAGFGKGAGERVRAACKNDGGRRLIVELTIGLKGDISAGMPLAELIAASRATDAGCSKGIVDRAGLQ